MARAQLRFSVGSLLGMALLTTLFCSAVAALGLEFGTGGSLPRHGTLGLIALFGRDAVSAFFIVATLLTGAAALSSWWRLFGNRTAAAIRHDGIELRGLFLSRRIPWRSLDRLGLRCFAHKGEKSWFIAAKSRCPRGAGAIHHKLANLSYGVPVKLLEGSVEDARRWVAEAQVAYRAALGSSASWRFDEAAASARDRRPSQRIGP
jgi:hypothetical protein